MIWTALERLAGMLLVTVGAWAYSWRAGLIVAGLLLLAYAQVPRR